MRNRTVQTERVIAPHRASLDELLRRIIAEQLVAYRRELQSRTQTNGRHFSENTRRNREVGAEDFALFLLGERPKNERVRGSVAALPPSRKQDETR